MGLQAQRIFEALYLAIRGDTVTETSMTNNDYVYTHRLPLTSSKLRLIVLRCRQRKHVVKYNHWFIPNRTYYTYTVEMVQIDDVQFEDYHVSIYPHLCCFWLVRTHAPHICAINAHIDTLLSE